MRLREASHRGKVFLLRLAAGLSAVAMGTVASRLFLISLSRAEEISRASPFLFPVLGAAGLCLLLSLSGPGVKGTGTDSYISGVRSGEGRLPSPLSPLKILATTLTVGSGGSGGLLGPTILAGSRAPGLLWGSRLDPELGRQCQIAGASAALASLLGTPVAASLLVTEVLHRSSIEYRGLLPALGGGWGGLLLSRLLWESPARPALSDLPLNWLTLWGALVAAALASLLGLGLVRGLGVARRRLDPAGTSRLTPIIGGLGVGLLAWLVGAEILGWGMAPALDSWTSGPGLGPRSWLLAPAKVLATILTVGSGGSGGVMGPALVTGALTANAAFSLVGGSLAASSISAMAAGLTAVSNVPVAAAVLMLELFGPAASAYGALGALVGFFLARSQVAYEASLAEKDLDSQKQTQPSF